jgi:hypothetical protein
MKITKRLLAAAAFPAFTLSGCYVVPAGPDGYARIYLPMEPTPFPWQQQSQPRASTQPAAPAALQARLYPVNDVATQTGMVDGTVTNMMSGKGRFQLNYRGELLTGEATRVSGDARKGVASAYGPNGSYMTCEYQMHTQYQGAGTCSFSNGARYQVHIGN